MIFVAIDSNDDQENINIQIDQLYRFQSSPRSLATINEPLYVREVIVTFGRARGHHDLHKGRGRRTCRTGEGRGGREEVFARACSLITGGERVSEKREGHANRRLHVCLSSLPFLSPAGASRARCFLIPWPNSLSRGETLIDIPLLRFERGISLEPEITFHSDTDHTFHTFSGVDRVPRNMGGEVDRWSRCRTIVGPFIFSKILKFSCRRMQGEKN